MLEMCGKGRGQTHICNPAETNECVRIMQIKIHTAVLLENERPQHRQTRKADAENEMR